MRFWCDLVCGFNGWFFIHSRHSNHPVSYVTSVRRYVFPYSAVSYLFAAFEHRFLRQFSQIEDKNEPGFLNSILVAGPVAVLLY